MGGMRKRGWAIWRRRIVQELDLRAKSLHLACELLGARAAPLGLTGALPKAGQGLSESDALLSFTHPYVCLSEKLTQNPLVLTVPVPCSPLLLRMLISYFLRNTLLIFFHYTATGFFLTC